MQNTGSGRRLKSTTDLYDRYKAAKRFDALEQLRTISVILVIAYHMQDSLWGPLHGALGVTVFFVISGFLITTLLLREEAREGKASLRDFYVRRIFRILPVYFLTFAAFAVLILGLGLGGQADDFRAALPYYLTYQNEFAPAAPFGHTWSLAVEEKFYLIWPALILLIPFVRRRRLGFGVALLCGLVVADVVGLHRLSAYAPILAGCVLALLMDSRRGFAVIERLTHPMLVVLFVLAAGVVAPLEHADFGLRLLFPLAVSAALPGLILGREWVQGPSRIRWLVYLGKYTYAAYLVHPLVKSGVDVFLAAGQEQVVVQIVRFLVTTVLTFAASVVSTG